MGSLAVLASLRSKMAVCSSPSPPNSTVTGSGEAAAALASVTAVVTQEQEFPKTALVQSSRDRIPRVHALPASTSEDGFHFHALNIT